MIKGSAWRSVYVTVRLLPFIVSFIRDWRGYLIAGGPRSLNGAQHRRRAAELRKTLGALGPSFIKGAQVLAQREDILMPAYTRELKKLQDQVPSFPVRDVARIIKANLGKAPEEVFDEFTPQPLAAASLGQVHRAVYRGRAVVVKVLRPGVEDLVRWDLGAVHFLLYFMSLFVDDNLVRSFYAVITEFERMMKLEMDFRNERRNAAKLRHNFRDDPRIRIPGFVDKLCTRQVAVIEFVEGARIDRPAELAAIGVDPLDLISLLVETYIRMAVIHGFIHADPHPGNLRVDDQKRLVIFDYGMALEFDDATRMELLKMVYAVVRRDVDTIVDGFYRLGMVDADINRGVLRDAATTLLDIQITQDVTPRQVQEIAQEILDTFYKFPLRLPNNLVYLFRASSLVEGVALQYNPRFNGIKESTPIVKRMLVEIAFEGKKPLKERVVDTAQELYATVKELVVIIHRLEREQLRVRIHEADLFELERYFNSFLKRLLAGLALVAVAIIFALGMVFTGRLIFLFSTLLVLALLYALVSLVPLPRGSQSSKPYFK